MRSAQIHIAAGNSLWVAGIATSVGMVLSVLAALAITRVSRPSARLLEASFLSPLVLPTLSYGLAALMFFSVLGIRPSLNLLIAGHLVVIAPFIFRTTLASLTQLDPALLEASCQSRRRALLRLPPHHPAADRAGHRGGLLPRLHLVDGQCPGLALPLQLPAPTCCRSGCGA